MSRLESLASVVPSQCLWGKLQNVSLLKVSKQVVMSFCVAGVALPHIFTCLQTRRTSFCGRRNTFASLSEDDLQFLGTRSTLETSDVILRGRRSTLDVACSFFLQIALSGLREVATLNTPQSTFHTLHFTPDTLHSTLYTLHLTLYTPPFTLHTLQFTPHTLHFTLHTSDFRLPIPHLTLNT